MSAYFPPRILALCVLTGPAGWMLKQSPMRSSTLANLEMKSCVQKFWTSPLINSCGIQHWHAECMEGTKGAKLISGGQSESVALCHTLACTWGNTDRKQNSRQQQPIDGEQRQRRETCASTERQRAFSCALCHRAHVGPGGVSTPLASAHSSACTPAAGQFQQTYLWVSTRAAKCSMRGRTEWKEWGRRRRDKKKHETAVRTKRQKRLGEKTESNTINKEII